MDKHTSVRNVNIDVLKGICAYLVIIIHCGFPFWSSYVDAEARVAVPLLFMISGYYCKGEWCEIKRKVINLVKIFAVSEVIYLIYHIIIRGDNWVEWLRETITLNAVGELIIRNSTRVFMVGWFLISLAYAYLGNAFIEKYGLKRKAFMLIPLLILWELGWQRMLMLFRIETSMLDIRWIRAMLFFLMGNYFRYKRTEIAKKAEDKKIYTMIFAGVCLVFAERFWMEHYLTYKPALSLYVGTIIMAVACFVGAIYLPEMKYLKFFAYVGKNLSLYIYVVHMLIFEVMVKKFGNVHIVWVAVVVTIVAFVIHKIFDIRLRKCS